MLDKILGGKLGGALKGLDLSKLLSGNKEEMMAAVLPMLSEQLQTIDRPESKGGVLREDESKATYLLMDSGNGPQMSIACLVFDQDTKRLYINRVLNFTEAAQKTLQIEESNEPE